MRIDSTVGVQVPDVLLPKSGVDLSRWAVIACDQFTSEPEYWQSVADLVGEAPSTLHIVLPEVYLGSKDEEARIGSIQRTMRSYLDSGVFVEREGFVLVERQVSGRVRYGLMVALDLEAYDFSKGSTSLIRATEGTIVERIPPRVRIRAGAPLEVPHILVLIDDPERTVIEPLVAARQRLKPLYETELMLGSGKVAGHLVADPDLEASVLTGLRRLADPEYFTARYGLPAGTPVMLFAMGDGNHSLATAKTIWEGVKSQVGPDHPARYAMVEIENIHDSGLVFEPILRVLFQTTGDIATALRNYFGDHVCMHSCASPQEMIESVDRQPSGAHAFGIVTAEGCRVATVANPPSNLPVGTLQSFLDNWGAHGGFSKIDYVHGAEVTLRLGSAPGNVGLYLPAIDKGDFFKTVIVDGALPRKTFSMGEAIEKRFYMEARRIS